MKWSQKKIFMLGSAILRRQFLAIFLANYLTGGACSVGPRNAPEGKKNGISRDRIGRLPGIDRDIKIVLVDDHEIMREALRNLIEVQPNLTVVGEAGDGRTAVQMASKLLPDIMIMDISMPDLNGIEATRQILSASAATKVIALSAHYEKRFVLEMLHAGASGYLIKDCAFKDLIHAINTVAANSTYFSPRITEIVLKDYLRRIPPQEFSEAALLTAREREVLQLLSEGKRTKEIASTLQVSVKTVETYRQQIMTKLDIHSIAELTKFAVREGLTTL
jgi:DNA-binding NarL/FixJ family response regulator